MDNHMGAIMGSKIKKPKNCYFLWATERRRHLSLVHPGHHPSVISKILGKEWKLLSPDVKQSYAEIAKKSMEEFKKNCTGYKYRPRRKRPKLVKNAKETAPIAGALMLNPPSTVCDGKKSDGCVAPYGMHIPQHPAASYSFSPFLENSVPAYNVQSKEVLPYKYDQDPWYQELNICDCELNNTSSNLSAVPHTCNKIPDDHFLFHNPASFSYDNLFNWCRLTPTAATVTTCRETPKVYNSCRFDGINETTCHETPKVYNSCRFANFNFATDNPNCYTMEDCNSRSTDYGAILDKI